MIETGLRAGDVVIVLYMRDLGGSPVADRSWRKRIEAMGVKVVERRPEKPAAKIGRPPKVEWTDDQAANVRAHWLGLGSETARLQRIAEYLGYEVGKGLLTGRFGNPSNPKQDQR